MTKSIFSSKPSEPARVEEGTDGRRKKIRVIFASYSALNDGHPCNQVVTAAELATTMPVDITERIWLSFYNSVYQVGRGSLAANLISGSEIIDEEAYLFLGLPALTALECVLRSISCEGFHLFIDVHVSYDDCPALLEPLFDGLQEAKQQIAEALLTPTELNYCRQITLYSAHKDPSNQDQIQEERLALINRIVACVQVSGVS
jgi:hypothetical protein